MKRKLIKQGGGGGLTFYVPKKWVDERNLKPGDEIDVEEVDEGLLLSAKPKDAKEETSVSIATDHEVFIRIVISNLYRLGYDRVIVRCTSKKQMDMVSEVVERRLLGFEVTDRKGSSLVLENITGPSEEKHDVILRRVFMIIKCSFSSVQESLDLGSFKDFEEIKKDTFKVDQYINFLRRNISKKRFTDRRTHFYWALYNYLLLVQHSLLHLCENLAKIGKSQASKNVMKIYQQISQEFDHIETSFFTQDLDGIRKCSSNAESILKSQILPALSKSSGMDSISLYYCAEMARILSLSISPILGILLGAKPIESE